jgi:hypothetical protein
VGRALQAALRDAVRSCRPRLTAAQPTAGACDHLAADHAKLVARADTLTRRTDRLREAGNGEGRPPAK